jgi:hypothetical protein
MTTSAMKDVTAQMAVPLLVHRITIRTALIGVP